MKTGLVLEGGAMRGMFTTGVLDVFMENDITFDGAIGVSAGAIFGSNLKSHQIGRGVRYNKNYCRDKRYVSYRSWIFTGDLYNAKFDYEVLPVELDVFDTKAYQKNPMEFYVVATNVDTGKPVYQRCDNGDAADIQWFRASASMPIFSRVVKIGDLNLLDGGTVDPIPLRHFQEIGYERNVVILTRNKEYRKTPNKMMGLIRMVLRKYPKLIHALEVRHDLYNETVAYVEECDRNGSVLMIRPPEPLNIKQAERDPDELERVYQMGRREGEKYVERVKEYLRNGQ